MERLDSLPALQRSGAARPETAPAKPALAKRKGNLCAEAQSKVLRVGVLFFSLTLAAAIVLAKAEVAAEWRWLLALPFFVAIVGVSESLLQTCPFMALKNLRDEGEGIEPIADPQERSRMRARGKGLLLASASIALVAAGVFAQLPL